MLNIYPCLYLVNMLILSYIAFIKIEIFLDKYKIMHRLLHYKTFKKNISFIHFRVWYVYVE